MAFGMSGLGNNKNTSAAGGTRNTASVSDAGGQSRAAQELQNLKSGQTFRGEVVAKNGSEVRLKLDGDAVVTARLEKDMNLVIGQPMTFEVKSSNSALLALRPLFENTAQDANGMRALKEAALPINQKTLSMVSALMEQGMGIDKKTMQGVYRDLMTNAGSSPADLVALHKLGMEVTPENLQQMEGYRNFEHQLLKGIETIAESMKDTLLQMVDTDGSAQHAASLLRDLIGAIVGQTAADGMEGAGLTAETAGQPDASSGSLPEEAQAALDASKEALTAQGHTGGAENAAAQARADSQVLPDNLSAGIWSEGAAPGQEPADPAAQPALQDAGAESAGTAAKDGGLLPAGRDGLPLFTGQQREALASGLEALGVTAETVEQVRAGEIGTGRLLEQIARALSSGNVSREDLTSLLQGKEMQQLLKGQIENNWLLTPQQTASKEEIDRLYTRLREQTGKLTRILADAGKSSTGFAKNVQNLKENVDFIQQLNQNFTYLQLPVKRFGKNAHGDLYVYTNKKNLAKKDGNVSALLHLDMDYLGSMDIYISMQKERVSTKFYLQKEEMLDFLEANMHILNERLLKRGYTMNAQVLQQEKQANVAQEMMKKEGETSILSMFSFDVRA